MHQKYVFHFTYSVCQKCARNVVWAWTRNETTSLRFWIGQSDFRKCCLRPFWIEQRKAFPGWAKTKCWACRSWKMMLLYGVLNEQKVRDIHSKSIWKKSSMNLVQFIYVVNQRKFVLNFLIFGESGYRFTETVVRLVSPCFVRAQPFVKCKQVKRAQRVTNRTNDKCRHI